MQEEAFSMNLRSSAIALILTLGSQQFALANSHRIVVLSGQPAPGAPQGTAFSTFANPVINQAGDIAFNATLGSSDGAESFGVWAASGSSLRKVVHSGEPAEGFPTGYVYGRPSSSAIDEQGRVAFTSPIVKPESAGSIEGVPYSEGFGTLRRVADGPSALTSLAFGGTGKLAFKSVPLEAGVAPAVYADVSGVATKVLGQGDPAPGHPGYVIKEVDAPVINDSGLVLMSTLLEGALQPKQIRQIYKLDGDVLAPLIEFGKNYPGLEPGASFSSVGPPTVNNSGEVLFLGGAGGGASGSSVGMFRYSGGTINQVMRYNLSPSNPTPGPRFSGTEYFRINGAGEATFTAIIRLPTDNLRTSTSIWTQHDGNLVLVAESSGQVPGFAVGVKFIGPFAGYESSCLAVNANGQLAFEAAIGGPGIFDRNGAGIWATDLSGNLRVVVQKGDSLDVNDDPQVADFRTISAAKIALDGGGGEDGRRSSFNDAGELAVMLKFTDGSSGVFVFNTLVPEPSSLLTVGLAAVLVPSLRKRLSRS